MPGGGISYNPFISEALGNTVRTNFKYQTFKPHRKVANNQPVPTLVSPVQSDGKLTYPYADITPAPGNTAGQTESPADTSANAQPESEGGQSQQSPQEGAPEESSDLGARPYGQPSPYGPYGGNQRPNQFQGGYGSQQGYLQQGPYGGYPNPLQRQPGPYHAHPGTQHCDINQSLSIAKRRHCYAAHSWPTSFLTKRQKKRPNT